MCLIQIMVYKYKIKMFNYLENNNNYKDYKFLKLNNQQIKHKFKI